MAIRDLTAKIRVTVDSTGAVTGIKSVDTELGKLDGEIKQVDESTSALGGTFTRFSTIAVAAWLAITVAARAAGAALEAFRDATIRAGQERGLEIQLGRQEIALESFVKQLDDAAKGALTRADSIAAATRAIALGVDLQAIPQLLEIARKSTVVTGQTITQAFEDIAIGTARQSRLILDNLGIIIDAEEANERYAESLGKTTEALTDLERRQAFLNAVLETGAKSFGDIEKAAGGAAVAMDRLQATFGDAVNETVNLVAESSLLEKSLLSLDVITSGNIDSARRLLAIREEELQATEGQVGALRLLAIVNRDLARRTVENLEAQQGLTTAIVAVTEAEVEASDAAKEYSQNLETLIGVGFSALDAQALLEQQLINNRQALLDTGEAASVLTEEIESDGPIITSYREEFEKLHPVLVEDTDATESFGDAAAASVPQVQALTVAVAALTQEQQRNFELSQSLGIIGGELFGDTSVTFGTVRDEFGNVIQSAGSRLIQSDGNGGFTFTTGGNFTSVGIPEDFSSFGGIG